MASMEENFPRGGTQKKPSEGKAPRRPIEQDNLFNTHNEEGSQKRKRIQEDQGKRKKLKAEKKEVIKANAKDFELLTVEALSEGMLLLGCVKESNDFELVVSLPNGLTGFVQVTHICDAYSKMLDAQVATEELLEDLNSLSDLYPPGMLIRCTVTSVGKTMDGHQSVKLSINPKDVNKALNTTALRSGMLLSGLVSSVEDHGYLIDIGVSGAKAFLPRQKSQSYIKSANKGAELKIGQYLNCLIEEVKNNGRIVRLSISQSEVAAAIATEEQNWTLSNLLPGLVVKAQVQKVTPYGITLSFLSSFTGIVDFMHLDPKKVGSYSQSQTVKACIFSVHPTSKAVRLTLRQVFLQPGSMLGQLASSRIGMVVEEAVVKSFHTKTGAIFELDDGTLAFARLKHLSDTKKSFKPGAFKMGSKHRCRIIDYSLMDELALLSLKHRIIAAPFLRYQDICPGHVVEGKVLALKPLGMQVKVTDHIRGLVPRLHLADVLLKQPEKKYSVGGEVKCRVLISNPEEKKLILTLKKTLVMSKFPVLTSYEAAKPGLIAHGFIVCAREFGCIVKFYNDVKGLVPKNELSSEPISSPEKVFYKGQVVKVIVLKCEPEQEKLLLSFKLMSRPVSEDGGEQIPKKNREVTYETGQMVDVKVLRKKDNGLEVSILSDNVSAHLPMMHLSDHVVNCKLLYHWLQEGDILHRVMCLSDKGGHITLCRKPAVISAVQEEQVVRSFSEIQPGMQLAGYVRNIMSYGVFVEFPFGLAGLAPKAAMSDKFVTDTKDHFVVGQTVVANVTSMDEEKQRILLCLKLSEVGSEDPVAESFSLLSQCFEELKEVRGILSRRNHSQVAQNLCGLIPGQKLELVVQEVRGDGSAFFNDSCVAGLTVTATRYHVGDKSLVAGQKARVLVLHVDALKSAVHVSLREELLRPKAKGLMENSQHPAVVQHVAEEFAIASLVETGQLTAIPVASHFNDTFRFDSEKLKVGQVVSVTLKTVLTGDHGILLAVQGPAKKRAFIRSRKESETVEEGLAAVKHSLCLGDVVKGTVKSVRPTYVTVAIDDKLTGSIHTSQILDEVPIGTFPTSRLKAGQKVTARVIGGRDVKTHRYLPITHPHFTQSIPELSIRPSDLKGDGSTALSPEGDNPSERLRPYKAGQTVTCFVKKYNTTKTWLEVEITPEIRGRVPQLLLSLNPKVLKHPEKSFKNGQALSATVTGTDASETNLCLSLTGVHSLAEGTITLGTITKVTPHVCLTIALPFGKTGKASIFHLSDSYAEQPLENFSIGKLVRCCVLSNEDNKIEISLRQSRTNPKSKNKVEDPEITCVEDVREGQLVRGYVRSVKQSGVFCGLSSSVVGRVQFHKVVPFFIPKQSLYEQYMPEGKFLTAKVLSVNNRESHVELSLLPEDTGKPSILPESLGLPRCDTDEGKGKEKREEFKKLKSKRKRRVSEGEQEVKPGKKRGRLTDGDDSGVEVYCREEEEEEEDEEENKRKSKETKRAEAPRLQVSSGFTWDEGLNALEVPVWNRKEESSDSEEEDDTQSMRKKQTKKEQEQEKQRVEKELSKIESALMDPNRQPQTADDFDRLVLSNPSSSILWLQYMAFHLQATEMEKARVVAERALKTISFREEQEKLNVWVALLNLENMYGTEETLMKVFERAVQYNEPLKVFQHLADIYASSEKYQQADDLYNTMLKRFRQEKSVWLKYATFLLKRGQVEATHRLLERALKGLPDKEHVDVISKFAQLEFHFGDPEHAKAIFESTLSSYPKRTDIWSIYIDMMIKHGSQKEVRDIFERVIHLSLAAKRMKFFFKRYLDYEKKYGTSETIQAVKVAALEYVESKSSLAES
ncbi:protein RRP5 homolog isoform X2 [Chelonia mydas]|uniref:protein RRP5 homolog isoform X2 n=1 Tax=Chelonia mydas TaxID=8469 RepID=UPI0018A20867|nr:protein RRP5 homolog isoform X2 [Chelonia mydas]